jgi:rubrerythrin
MLNDKIISEGRRMAGLKNGPGATYNKGDKVKDFYGQQCTIVEEYEEGYYQVKYPNGTTDTMREGDLSNSVAYPSKSELNAAWAKMSEEEKIKACKQTGSSEEFGPLNQIGGSTQDVLENWVAMNKLGYKFGNSVDDTREGQEGWVKVVEDGPDKMANAKLECQECGKIFSKSNPTADTKCPGCGGYDIDLANSYGNYNIDADMKAGKSRDVIIKTIMDRYPDIARQQAEKIVDTVEKNGPNAPAPWKKDAGTSPGSFMNCTHCLGNGILPLVGTPCPVCNAPKEE